MDDELSKTEIKEFMDEYQSDLVVQRENFIKSIPDKNMQDWLSIPENWDIYCDWSYRGDYDKYLYDFYPIAGLELPHDESAIKKLQDMYAI